MPFGINMKYTRKMLYVNMLGRIATVLITDRVIFAELCHGRRRINSVPTAYEKAKKMCDLAWH